MILNRYKNDLLKIIQESSISPNLFIADNKKIDNTSYFVICIPDTNILFAIRPWGNSFVEFQYTRSLFLYRYPLSSLNFAGDWDTLTAKFKEWIEEVVKPYLEDINTPNLWHIFQESQLNTKSELGTPKDFDLFSDDEKIQIRLCINDFRLLIINQFEPSKEELESINSRLKYLTDAIDKHNRFDWKGIAINTLISITIALSMNPEQAQKLFQIFKEVFSNVIYLLNEL